MPQPLKIKGTGLRVSHTVLLDHPIISQKIALISAAWQSVENDLGSIFVFLLGGHETAALEIFNNLIDRNLRKQALLVVARDRLPKSMIDRVIALFKDAREMSSSRNNIIHGTWASSPLVPGFLLLINPSDLNKIRHLTMTNSIKRALDNAFDNKISRKPDHKYNVIKYTSSDFDDIYNRITDFRRKAIETSVEVLEIVTHYCPVR